MTLYVRAFGKMTDTSIDWGKYVQSIYCLHYLPYKDRLDVFKKELAKMDILQSSILSFYWTYYSKFDKMIVDSVSVGYPDFYNARSTIASNVTLAYYHIFKEAIALELDAIVTIEDDLRFSSTKDEMLHKIIGDMMFRELYR